MNINSSKPSILGQSCGKFVVVSSWLLSLSLKNFHRFALSLDFHPRQILQNFLRTFVTRPYGVLLPSVFPSCAHLSHSHYHANRLPPTKIPLVNKDTHRPFLLHLMCSSQDINAFLFEPFEAKSFRSDAKHRQKRKTPAGVYTCWEINTSTSTWNDRVPCCAPCGRFIAEKALRIRLSKLTSNCGSLQSLPVRHILEAY
jgi:hypothetical protein